MTQSRRKSHEDRRRAIIIKDQKGGAMKSDTLKEEADIAKDRRLTDRLMDERRHELPQKLLNASKPNQTRKMSFLKDFSFLPGRNNQDRKGRKAHSPHLAPRKMPIIHQSDTDTDTEIKKPLLVKLHPSANNSNLERNESNSSADNTADKRLVSRNDSLKETHGVESIDSEPSDGASDFENDTELNTADEPENWWSFTQAQREESDQTKVINKRENKRQENIYEFIHTELNHSRTLRIMQVRTKTTYILFFSNFNTFYRKYLLVGCVLNLVTQKISVQSFSPHFKSYLIFLANFSLDYVKDRVTKHQS